MERTTPHVKETSQKYTNKYEMNALLVLEAVKSSGYLVLNKSLIKNLGALTAIVLSNYIEKFQYFKTKERFNGWFFLKHQDIMKELSLTESTVKKAKNELIEKGILKTRMKSVPSKEWIWIDFTEVGNHLISSAPQDLAGLDPQFSSGLYNKPKLNKVILPNLKPSSGRILVDDFEKFWKLYPSKRRGSKGKALSSWIKIAKSTEKFRPSFREIEKAIAEQKKSDQWQEEQFIPYASTWLNNKRWLDDPGDLKRHKFKGEEDEPEKRTRNTYLDQFDID